MRVRYISHFGPEGQFVAAKRLRLALAGLGTETAATPMDPGDAWGFGSEPFAGWAVGDPDRDHLCTRRLDDDTVLLHLGPGLYPRRTARERGELLVGPAGWETDRLSPHWAADSEKRVASRALTALGVG